MKLIDRFNELELEVRELRRKVEALEDFNVDRSRFGVWQPWNPYMPRTTTAPDLPYPFIKQDSCPVCGLKFDGPMGYACNNPKCPTRVSC